MILKNIFLFLNFFIFTEFVEARPLSMMQEQVKICEFNLDKLENMISIKNLYDSIDRKYLLMSEKIVEREVLYQQGHQSMKLKVYQDAITLFRVDDEGRVHAVSFDAKQKVSTPMGRIKQLLLNKVITSDWGQYLESREKGLQVNYSLRDGKYSQMKVLGLPQGKVLTCEAKSETDVCSCRTK